MGKIKVDNMDTFRDTATIMALYDAYATCEPFIPCEYGIRVQKVGPTYRVYKKNFTGAGWKVCTHIYAFVTHIYIMSLCQIYSP